jgi:histidyl-tRNA synthetase
MAKNTNKIEPRLLKGFRDYNPAEQAARQDMFQKIQTVFERFGFAPLSTPALEYKEILMGKYGEDEKLIYAFKDNGDRDVAMRYDLTVPLARYVAQNLNQLALPFKRYQIAPVWRADNPQKGRLREFYQCDIDTLGTESVLADAEIVACIFIALKELGLNNLKVTFNNRMLYERLLTVDKAEQAVIMRAMDKLAKIGRDAVLDILRDQKVSAAGQDQAANIIALGKGSEAYENIPKLFPDAASVVSAPQGFQFYLESFGVPAKAIVFDPTTVRGLDYYTNMVFEIVMGDNPEYGSIAGGGRYDSLLETFSETSVPAVGGSIGIDRLFEAMEALGLIKSSGIAKVLIMNLDENLVNDYVALATELRGKGIATEVYYQTAKLDKQFKYAESRGIQYAVIMGSEEKDKGTVQLKNLATREQTVVELKSLAAALT